VHPVHKVPNVKAKRTALSFCSPACCAFKIMQTGYKAVELRARAKGELKTHRLIETQLFLMQSMECEYFKRFSDALSKAFTSRCINYVGGNMLNNTCF